MTPQLDGLRLKLRRAWDQLKEIETELRAFVKSNFYEPQIEFDTQSQVLTIKVHIRKSPDPTWGVKIGETIHNLRSTLDYSIWELYILNNRCAPVAKQNQFPVFETEAGFNGRGVKKFLNGIAPEAVALIKSEQPFPQENGGTGEGIKSPLWHLKELSDADKHRTIHLTATLIEQFDFRFPPLKQTVKVRSEIRNNLGPINEDTVLARAYLSGCTDWPFTETEVNSELRTDIAFDQRTPAVGGWLVFGTLVDIANRTERILRRIADEIFRTEL